MGELEGLKAVVTGSGGGMGGGIAVKLAQAGVDVVLNDRLPDRTDRYEKIIRELGRDVVSVVDNVTRRDGAEAVINAALERWGRVDILMNVVGGIKGPVHNPIWEIKEEEWEITLGVCLRGTFHCTQLVLKGMMERRFGKIVNIASTSWAGTPEHTHYAVAKAGVVAFTRSVASQLGPYNINVNAIAPGATRTNEGNSGGDPSTWKGMNPLSRPNEPEDVADAALFLVSEQARNITGQLLTVAGGLNPSL
ncbi:MAG: SDR family oxidoreductase [Chloroflexi bacterium]|nr:SDR family oxidoreductase [Chloroflexota bacterium]MCI0770107.1 SDR family oxidoreductase [Chloroflexota bacterium]